jgi:hypothetical protein
VRTRKPQVPRSTNDGRRAAKSDVIVRRQTQEYEWRHYVKLLLNRQRPEHAERPAQRVFRRDQRKKEIRLFAVITRETELGTFRREDFWFIVAARSEDETEIRAA